jgi:hypothetical protein
MVVQRNHGDPATAQRDDDALDLAARHGEIAVDRGPAAAEGWKFSAVVTPRPGGMT